MIKKVLSSFFVFSIITHNVSALSASTVNVIHGSAPYITFDEYKTQSDLSPLLSIALPNGEKISPLTDTSSATQPIRLNTNNTKFADIQTFVPFPVDNINYPTKPLSDIIVGSNYWWDMDGDGSDKSPTVTGNLKVTWQDDEGNDITNLVKNQVDTLLDGCLAPYKLTVSATQGTISTTYGIPKTRSFSAIQHSYYIYPKVMSTAKFCYAKPNVEYENDINGEWKKGKGFIFYDPNNVHKNFPTTGSNNLFFDLKIAGLSAKELIKINGESVSQISGSGVSLALSDHQGFLRVTLKGPSASTNGGQFQPSTFRLYADYSKTNVFYTFTLQRWYIAFIGPSGSYANSKNKCNSLNGGYRIPNVLELTNSNREYNENNIYIGWTYGIPGVGPEYRRMISYKNDSGTWMGGLFAEWGNTTNFYYKSSDWDDYNDPYFGTSIYWSSNIFRGDAKTLYVVDSRQGIVGTRADFEHMYLTACITP